LNTHVVVNVFEKTFLHRLYKIQPEFTFSEHPNPDKTKKKSLKRPIYGHSRDFLLWVEEWALKLNTTIVV